MGSLQFLNPSLLAFLPLVAIPIALHFWQRRYARHIPFAAIELLEASQHEVRRRITLKHLLLLLFKILLVLSFVLSGAKPVYSHKKVGTAGSAPRDYVFVVDISPSMHYQHEGRTFLEQAKERLQETIHSAVGNDRYALLTFSGGLLQDDLAFFDNRQEAQAGVDSLQPVPQSSNLGLTLVQLEKLARGTTFINQPTFVIMSDFTAGISGKIPLSVIEQLRSLGELAFVDVADGVALQNVVIDRVERLRGLDGLELRFSLRNSLTTSTTAKLFLAGEQIASAVLSPGQQTLTYSLGNAQNATATDATRASAGELRFDDTGLEIDNVYSFNTEVERRFRVLLVNDDPTGREIYYLKQALIPVLPDAKANVVADVVGSEDLEHQDFSPYVGIFLINLSSLRLDRAKAIERAVRAGKLLCIILGDSEKLDFYNRWESMFPWQVLGTMDSPTPLSIGRLVSEGEWSRHRFSSLPFEKLQFKRYFSVTPLPQRESNVLLTLDNGAPLLLVSNVDRGMVYLFASSLDDKWSNFPLKTAFLPFWHELITRSLPESEQGESSVLTFDDNIKIRRSGRGSYVLERLGDKLRIDLTRRGDDLIPVRLPAQPGNYAVLLRDVEGERAQGILTLRHHPDEMALAKLPALRASKGHELFVNGSLGQDKEEIKLWPYLQFLAVLLFALDGLALWLL